VRPVWRGLGCGNKENSVDRGTVLSIAESVRERCNAKNHHHRHEEPPPFVLTSGVDSTWRRRGSFFAPLKAIISVWLLVSNFLLEKKFQILQQILGIL
jgi:hypothetical protein